MKTYSVILRLFFSLQWLAYLLSWKFLISEKHSTRSVFLGFFKTDFSLGLKWCTSWYCTCYVDLYLKLHLFDQNTVQVGTFCCIWTEWDRQTQSEDRNGTLAQPQTFSIGGRSFCGTSPESCMRPSCFTELEQPVIHWAYTLGHMTELTIATLSDPSPFFSISFMT